MKHLCDSCTLEFATCPASGIVFGIDRDPSLRGKDADVVLECGSHSKRQTGWKCDFCGNDGVENQPYNRFCAYCSIHR